MMDLYAACARAVKVLRQQPAPSSYVPAPPSQKFTSEVRTFFHKSHVLICYDGEPFCRIEPSWDVDPPDETRRWRAMKNERAARARAELFLRKMEL